MDVGVVKALDVHRQFLHAQIGLQGGEDALLVGFGVYLLKHLVLVAHVVVGVALAQLEQTGFIATLGHMQLDAFQRYIHLEGEVDFRTITLVLLAQFYDGVCQQFLIGFGHAFAQFRAAPVHDGPVANFEVVHVAAAVVTHNAEHLNVVDARVHHSCFLLEFFDHFQPGLKLLGAFKIKRFRSAFHLPLEGAYQLTQVPFKDASNGGHIRVVVFLRLVPFARAQAIA